MAFSYDPAWVDAEEGRPLSLSLPINLDGLTLKGDRVGNYFDNLLPDSEPIRRRIQTKFIGSPRFVVGISTPRPMPAASVGT